MPQAKFNSAATEISFLVHHQLTKESGPDLKLRAAQEALLDRGFTDGSSEGEALVNAVIDTTIHRDKQLLIHAYNLLYHHRCAMLNPTLVHHMLL